MVTTAKVLKRKDGASVIVAVIIAMIVGQVLPTVTGPLAGTISGLNDGQYIGYAMPGSGFQGQYLHPVVWGVLQLIVLEIVLWLYTSIVASMKKK